MSFDGSGVFTRDYNFTADKNADIKIRADRVDAEFDNFAEALNDLFLRNGLIPMAGPLKLGNNLINGIAAGAEDAPSVSFNGDNTTGFYLPAAGVVACSVGGIERGRFTSSGFSVTDGFLGINTEIARSALDVAGVSSLRGVFEDTLIAATGLTGTAHLDAKTRALAIYTANAAANWTFNVRGDSGTTLNSFMGINQTMTLAIEVPQGATSYYCTAITIDGVAPSQIKWFDGAPAGGDPNSINVYTITIIKTADATFLVRASIAQMT